MHVKCDAKYEMCGVFMSFVKEAKAYKRINFLVLLFTRRHPPAHIHTRTHTRARAQTLTHTHTHTDTHSQRNTHTRARARTHTHTHRVLEES